MDWGKSRRSDNVVEDTGGGGGGGGFGGGRLGLGGVAVVVVVSLLLGKNPLDVLALLSGGSAPTTSSVPRTAPAGNDSQTDFVRAILGSTEDTWGEMFSAAGKQYPAPKLVLFHGQTQSGCGRAAAAMGPFYCPQDREVYLDLDFFQEMETRFHAAGDLARAYVIAHEVGHHVQNLLGRMRSVDEARERGAPMEGANGLSVRLELQADCYAGVWANRAQQRLQWLQAGDVEGALAAATAIGDDALQKQSRGAVVPDAFTHGTSAMRVHWFRAGMESGEIKSCDTFRTAQL